jgi:hypothetical protein
MYEGWTRLIFVFLTHPGIVVNPPATGIGFLWLRGLLQASIVLIMHSASETKWKLLMEYAYWGAFALWFYIKVQLALVGR